MTFLPKIRPHFGGVWERLVKCCKSSLTHVLNGGTVFDEVLYIQPLSRSSRWWTDGHSHTSAWTPRTHSCLLRITSCWEGRIPTYRLPSSAPRRDWRAKVGERPNKSRTTMVDRIHFKPYGKDQVDEKRESPTSYRPGIGWRQDERERNRPAGRVIKLMPGKDGEVRTAVFKTKPGEHTRPVL